VRRYRNILGCSSVDLTNTTELYARYTTTVLCNAIVQASRQPCGLSNANAVPLCAGACVRVPHIQTIEFQGFMKLTHLRRTLLSASKQLYRAPPSVVPLETMPSPKYGPTLRAAPIRPKRSVEAASTLCRTSQANAATRAICKVSAPTVQTAPSTRRAPAVSTRTWRDAVLASIFRRQFLCHQSSQLAPLPMHHLALVVQQLVQDDLDPDCPVEPLQGSLSGLSLVPR
jgi:hypothetical protein